MQEFERRTVTPIEFPYDQGRETMVDLIEKAIVVGEKPEGYPFLIALWGQTNSGKTHLSGEIIAKLTAKGLSVESHTDHQSFGTSSLALQRINTLDVLIVQDINPKIWQVRGQTIPYIHSLQREPQLRVQIFNPTLHQIPQNDPIDKIHLRINNSNSTKK